MSREDQFSVTASIDGEDLGIFQTFSGGETSSESTKNRPGGMGDEESLGGPASVENVTFARRFRPERDGELERRLRSRCGRAGSVVKKQPLDVDGNPFGSPTTYTGTLIRVAGPDSDSNSSDVAMIELEVECNGTVS